jgi:hypothetical protein
MDKVRTTEEEGEDELALAAEDESSCSPALMLHLLWEVYQKAKAFGKPSPILLKLVLRAYGSTDHCGTWLRMVISSGAARVDADVVQDARALGVAAWNISYLEAVKKRQLQDIKSSFLPPTVATKKSVPTKKKPVGKKGPKGHK